MPVKVTAFLELSNFLFALENNGELRLMGGHINGPVKKRLIMHNAPRLEATRGRNNGLGLGIINPHSKLARCKAAKNNRMHSTKPRTGQHGLQRFRHHRHIDDHTVALFDPLGAQRTCECCDAVAQLDIRNLAFGVSDGAVIDNSRLLAAPCLYMAVNGIIACVALGVGKPLIQIVALVKERL